MMDKVSIKSGRYDRQDPLNLNMSQSILDMYLLRGLNKPIRFSEFEKVLYPKVFKHKKSLERYLGYLVRDGILKQEEKGEPYYLQERYTSAVAQEHQNRIMKVFSSSQIIPFPTSSLSIIIYGFDHYHLNTYEEKKLRNAKKEIQKALNILYSIKVTRMRKCWEKALRDLQKSRNLTQEERIFLSDKKTGLLAYAFIGARYYPHIDFCKQFFMFDNLFAIGNEYDNLDSKYEKSSFERIKEGLKILRKQKKFERNLDLSYQVIDLLIPKLQELAPYVYGITAFQGIKSEPSSRLVSDIREISSLGETTQLDIVNYISETMMDSPIREYNIQEYIEELVQRYRAAKTWLTKGGSSFPEYMNKEYRHLLGLLEESKKQIDKTQKIRKGK